MNSRLPNEQLAIIDRRKITDYLLASGHPTGRAKAAFFRSFGFTAAAWQRLRDALLDHAHSAAIVSTVDTQFGTSILWMDRSPRPMDVIREFERFGLSKLASRPHDL